MPFGSTVYGTRLPTSDTDVKEVFLPSARDIVLQRAPRALTTQTKTGASARNAATDVSDGSRDCADGEAARSDPRAHAQNIDVDRFSLQFFLALVMDGQTTALEMLFVDPALYLAPADPVWLDVLRHRERFLSRKASSFVRYCRAQANKYGAKGARLAALRTAVDTLACLPPQAKLEKHRPALEKLVAEHAAHARLIPPDDADAAPGEWMVEVANRKVQLGVTAKHAVSIFVKALDGYGERSKAAAEATGLDWKALMHAVRIAGEAEEFLRTGKITLPRAEAAFLLQIRGGEMPYEQVTELLDQRLATVEALVATSSLPAEPDTAFAEDFLYRHYVDVISNAK